MLLIYYNISFLIYKKIWLSEWLHILIFTRNIPQNKNKLLLLKKAMIILIIINKKYYNLLIKGSQIQYLIDVFDFG